MKYGKMYVYMYVRIYARMRLLKYLCAQKSMHACGRVWLHLL